MIRIDGPGRTGTAGQAGGARRTEGASTFRLPDGEPAAPKALSVGGPVNVGMLMALQQVDDPATRRRRQVRRGHDLLDELDQMKIDLLGGALAPDRMARLATLLKDREAVGHEGLDQALDDIDLRVRVELAKNGHFPD